MEELHRTRSEERAEYINTLSTHTRLTNLHVFTNPDFSKPPLSCFLWRLQHTVIMDQMIGHW